MARTIIAVLSFVAVVAATYDDLKERPFDTLGSQPFAGRSTPAASITEDSSRSSGAQFASTDSGASFNGESFDQLIGAGSNQFSGQRFTSGQISAGSVGLGQSQPSGQAFDGFSSSGFSGAQASGNVLLGQGSSFNAPTYEEHVLPRSGPIQLTSTVTNFVTKTHTLRVPATSDVWITSVTMVKVPVTQLSTRRSYVRGAADTVTSLVRITSTPVSVATRTVEIFPTKTVVSVFTEFVTETDTVELWQPIQHISTSYDVITRPILETQTLLQRAFRTVTSTQTLDVTSTRQIVFPRGGRVPAPARSYLF